VDNAWHNQSNLDFGHAKIKDYIDLLFMCAQLKI